VLDSTNSRELTLCQARCQEVRCAVGVGTQKDFCLVKRKYSVAEANQQLPWEIYSTAHALSAWLLSISLFRKKSQGYGPRLCQCISYRIQRGPVEEMETNNFHGSAIVRTCLKRNHIEQIHTIRWMICRCSGFNNGLSTASSYSVIVAVWVKFGGGYNNLKLQLSTARCWYLLLGDIECWANQIR